MDGRRAFKISWSGFAFVSSLHQVAISSQITARTLRPRTRRQFAVWTVIRTRLVRSIASFAGGAAIIDANRGTDSRRADVPEDFPGLRPVAGHHHHDAALGALEIPPGGKHILSTSAQLSTGARVARCDAVSSSDSASQETGHRPEDYKRFRDLSRQVRAVQRAAILNLRNENEINDEVMHKFEHELDSVEARFEASHDS